VRILGVDGVNELHSVITEADNVTFRNLDWNDLQAAAVERWATSLNPPGSTATLQQRIVTMLTVTGWELAPGASPEDQLVQRRATGFRGVAATRPLVGAGRNR
jgi:hypothetical protein